jgi:hypothetical protein
MSVFRSFRAFSPCNSVVKCIVGSEAHYANICFVFNVSPYWYRDSLITKNPCRIVGTTENENPSPYPLPSGERVKVRGDFQVKHMLFLDVIKSGLSGIFPLFSEGFPTRCACGSDVTVVYVRL